jgi:hypothetical protein
MPTRKPTAAPKSARVHRGLAAALVVVVLGGCAQVLGLEEWNPKDCEDVAEDPTVCEQRSCSECLFGAHSRCQDDKTACTADASGCGYILTTCSQSCAKDGDPETCIPKCCPNGNQLFDDYLTCVCDECVAECGTLTLGCNDYCTPP